MNSLITYQSHELIRHAIESLAYLTLTIDVKKVLATHDGKNRQLHMRMWMDPCMSIVYGMPCYSILHIDITTCHVLGGSYLTTLFRYAGVEDQAVRFGMAQIVRNMTQSR